MYKYTRYLLNQSWLLQTSNTNLFPNQLQWWFWQPMQNSFYQMQFRNFCIGESKVVNANPICLEDTKIVGLNELSLAVNMTMGPSWTKILPFYLFQQKLNRKIHTYAPTVQSFYVGAQFCASFTFLHFPQKKSISFSWGLTITNNATSYKPKNPISKLSTS